MRKTKRPEGGSAHTAPRSRSTAPPYDKGPHAPGGLWRHRFHRRCGQCGACAGSFAQSAGGTGTHRGPCHFWLDELDYTDEERRLIMDPAQRCALPEPCRSDDLKAAPATNCEECGWYVPDLPELQCKCGRTFADLPGAAEARVKYNRWGSAMARPWQAACRDQWLLGPARPTKTGICCRGNSPPLPSPARLECSGGQQTTFTHDN